MSYTERLKQVQELQEQIISHGDLPQDTLKKINQKFRLEWNYTSNSMEGNSLTKRETRTVMAGLSVNEKPVKDVIEMRQHDNLITTLIKIGRGDLNISESRIKEIHKAIMYEEDPEQAKFIGQWKNTDNYILNSKGERHDFAPHTEVKERLHSLINWVNAEQEKIKRNNKDAANPSYLAFHFQLEYLSIHPFYDGNGRTARILSNLILISFGYPPVYITEEEKANYYLYLSDIQGYGGDPDLFYEFMAGLLIRSQQMVLKAINGGSINDPSDLDKKLMLLERELEIIDREDEVQLHLNAEVFIDIYNNWVKAFLQKSIDMIQKFNRFFTGINHYIGISRLGSVVFSNQVPEDIITKLSSQVESSIAGISNDDLKIFITADYGTLKKGGLNTFDCNYNIEIKFNMLSYEVYIDTFSTDVPRIRDLLYEKLLHQPLYDTEIEQVVHQFGEVIYQHIDHYTKENGIR